MTKKEIEIINGLREEEEYHLVDGKGQEILSLPVSELKKLVLQESSSYFGKKLILGELEEAEIQRFADKHGIPEREARSLYIIELGRETEEVGYELLAQLLADPERDMLFSMGDGRLVLIHRVKGKKSAQECRELAEQIISTLNTELMIKGRVGYGHIAEELKELSGLRREAEEALRIAALFYAERSVVSYDELDIGRLIYDLPAESGRAYIREKLKEKSSWLTEDELDLANRFLEKNLNLSETARDLFMHRNTLGYHLDKIRKKTGLDIRNFDDAMTFKLVLLLRRKLEAGE